MIGNFMCLLGWAMVPSCVVRLYSGCFCECFWMKLTFKISGLWVKQTVLHNVGGLHPIGWNLNRTKDCSPLSKNSASRWPWDWSCSSGSSWVPSLLVHPVDFQLTCLHNCVSQFLKIDLFPYTQTHILLVLFFWRALIHFLNRCHLSYIRGL